MGIIESLKKKLPKEIYALPSIAQNVDSEQPLDGTINNFSLHTRLENFLFPAMSERVINGFFRRLTSDERRNIFIIDDRLFEHFTPKKTDMLAKVFYEYKGKRLSIKQIYSKNRKRRGRSKYLLSIDVMLGKENDKIPARIVFVCNKSNKKDWLAIISTDTTLSKEEIRSTFYDASNAHVALVFTRCMILTISQRSYEDPKTVCKILYYLANELADITFSSSLKILMQAMLDTITEFFI